MNVIGFFFFGLSPENSAERELDDSAFLVNLEKYSLAPEKNLEIIFDGISLRDSDDLPNEDSRIDINKVRTFRISLKGPKKAFRASSNFPNIWQLRLSSWLLLEITKSKTDIIAYVAEDDREFPEVSAYYVANLSLIPRSDYRISILKKSFNLKLLKSENEDVIAQHLAKMSAKNNSGHKLNVYKVGQGSLSAITNKENKPLVYFDLGGAWWIFPKSYPTTLNLCFDLAKTVIISHWDLDHLETARRLFHTNPKLLEGITWIAPKQYLSPFYLKIAAKMVATGRLLLWSKRAPNEISFAYGKLIKCVGPSKNHDGLALIVESPDNSIKIVLHPGDTAFKYIPNIIRMSFDGLVATHHGANFPYLNSPVPHCVHGENGCIAYSHDNKYGHPATSAVDAYEANGWSNRRDTIHGNISFCNGGNVGIPCGHMCTLAIDQTF